MRKQKRMMGRVKRKSKSIVSRKNWIKSMGKLLRMVGITADGMPLIIKISSEYAHNIIIRQTL
jgi:hypothetical protein